MKLNYTFLLTTISGAIFAANSLTVKALVSASAGQSVLLEVMDPGAFVGETSACVIPGGNASSEGMKCGQVQKMSGKNVKMSLTSGANLFHGGDVVTVLLYPKKVERIPAMTSNVSLEGGLGGPADDNLALGFAFGLNYNFPEAHFQYAVSRHVSLGIMGLMGDSSANLMRYQALGGFLTQTVFLSPPFTGFNLRLMEGIYRFTNSIGSQSEILSPLALGFQLGYRIYVTSNLDISANAGFQYLHFDTPSDLLDFGGFRPLFVLELGYGF